MGTETTKQGSDAVNVSINPAWAAFKSHLLRTVGHEEAGNWLRHAAAVMDMESRRKSQVIDAPMQQPSTTVRQ